MMEVDQQQQVGKFSERDLDEQYLLFGPLGENAYPPYAQEKIKATFGANGTPERNAQRAEMWQRYDQLLASLMESKAGDVPILDQIREFIKNQSDFARKQLEQTPPGGLGIHLKEVQAFACSLLLTADSESRFPQIISDRDAQLLSYVVTDVHDLLKFLGSLEAQVMPDHEVMTAELIRKMFLNQIVLLTHKTQDYLSQDDVEFIACVVGDHENIEKEMGRSDFIKQGRIERAKALFFVIDVLTGALQPVANEQSAGVIELQIDSDQLWSRFGDLYLRHMDPVEGKIFRPQWGQYALLDLGSTLSELQTNGLSISSSDEQSQLSGTEAMRETLIQAINLVLVAQELHEQFNEYLQTNNQEILNKLRDELSAPKHSSLARFKKYVDIAIDMIKNNRQDEIVSLQVPMLSQGELKAVLRVKQEILEAESQN